MLYDLFRFPATSVVTLQHAIAKELHAIGFDNSVSVTFAVNIILVLYGGGENARYAREVITVATGVPNHKRSTHPDAISALWDENLWGRESGQFTDQEWSTLSARVPSGESVAEMYDRHIQRMEHPDVRWPEPGDHILDRIADFFTAMRKALRNYFTTEQVMAEIRQLRMDYWDPDRPWRPSDLLTDAVSKSGSVDSRTSGSAVHGFPSWPQAHILGILPLKPLVTEIGNQTPALRSWLILRRESDRERCDIRSRTNYIVRKWTKLWQADRWAGEELNKLIQESTLAGIKPFQFVPELDADSSDHDRKKDEDLRRLSQMYGDLPDAFRSIYWEIGQEYTKMADRLQDAIETSIDAQADDLQSIKAHYEPGIKEARYEAAINDDPTEGDRDRLRLEAERDEDMAMFDEAQRHTLAVLRRRFDALRTEVHFPFGRFGEYAVKVMGSDGEIVSFSLFETSKAQQDFARDISEHPQDYGLGKDIEVSLVQVNSSNFALDTIPGDLLASVEKMTVTRDDLPYNFWEDQIWQTWMRTFPDLSIRKAHIHRKGTPGFSTDAIRNLVDRSFHTGHQVSRIRYSVQMERELLEAAKQANELGEQSERAQSVVEEIERRHMHWNTPDVSPWDEEVPYNAFTFVWYLGVTPATALVNLARPAILGPGVLGSLFESQGVQGAVKELEEAAKDFAKADFDYSKDGLDASKKSGMTESEIAALKWAHEVGLIERTEAFALAKKAEKRDYTNPNRLRNRLLNIMAWSFQSSEIANRSVTMLAAYRMSRKEGREHDYALDEAWEKTLEIHFNMPISERPRFTQGDVAHVITQFKQSSINMAVRLALDTRKAMNGATVEKRRHAHVMLATTMTAFLLHAGIRGLPLYGTVAMILGAIFLNEAGEESTDRLLEKMFSNGDGVGAGVWNTMLKIALDGPDGALTDADLRDHIGPADLFFRNRSWYHDASETWGDMASELLGPAWGCGASVARGIDAIDRGDLYRGGETATPEIVKDVMKAGRYASTGEITTMRGDVADVISPICAICQALDFTPLSEEEQQRLTARLRDNQNRLRSIPARFC